METTLAAEGDGLHDQGSVTCSSTGSARLEPWGLAGSMGTGRHGEDARHEAGSGKLASLRSMVSMTHFAAPQIQQYLSPHSHAELYLVLDLWTDNKHFITFL